MDNDKIKNWVMIGLLVSILVILVAQPMVQTEINTTAWITNDALWDVSETTVAGDVVEPIVLDKNRSHPYLNGDRLLYSQYVSNGTGWWNEEIMLLNLTTYELTNISDDPDYNFNAMIYKDKIAYNQINSSIIPIWMNNTNVYNITTGNTTEYDEYWGNYTLWYDPTIVNDEFIVFYNYTTDFAGLYAYNYIENYTYLIYNSSVFSDTEIDAYDDFIVFFGWGEDGVWLSEPNIYMHDFSTNTTELLLNTTDGYVYQAWYLSVWGDKIVYQDYNGDTDTYTIYLYNITTDETYAILPGWYSAWSPQIYDNTLVCFFTDEISPSIEQVALVNLDFEVFGEHYTAITNDSFSKDQIVISNIYVAWSQIGYDRMFPLEVASPVRSETADNDIIIYSYETYTETPTGQLATTYNLNWIYIVIILIVVVVGMFIYRLNDRTDWRYTR